MAVERTERFLAGAAKAGPPFSLMNGRTGRPVVESVELAVTSATRRKGLLGRDSLDASTAIVIAPTSAIHTAFMRFVIDVIFVDRSGRVLKIVRDLRPWRMAAAWGAYAVIELRGGCVGNEVAVGDRLHLTR